MRIAPSQAVTVAFRVKNSSGVLVDAGSTPTATVYRNGIATALVVTVTSTGTAGKYTAAWTSGAYAAGDQLQLEVTATVGGTTYTALVWEATIDAVAATHSAADAAAAVRSELTTELGRLDTAVSSRSSHTAAGAAGAVRTELATELGRIDVTVSSRLAAAAAPANFADLAITATTGQVTVGTNNDKSGYSISGSVTTLDALRAHGDAAWATAVGFSTHSAVDAASAVRAELAAELGRIDVAISSRLAATAAPANFAALGINVSGHISRVTLVDTTTANSDMRGTDGAALAGDEMTLTAGERSAIAVAVEAALLDEGDGQALIDAIISRIENDLDASDLSVAAIATAVRDAILDRVLALNHDTAGTVGKILQDSYAAATDLDSRATEARLAKLDRDLAAVADVSAAQAAIIAQGDSAWVTANGFSTHSAADVAAAILTTPANKLQTDASGFVTIAQAFPANFAALGINAEGHVSRVTLVDTTTANSDMRGTDGANTVVPPTAEMLRDSILDRILVGNHEVAGSLGAAIPGIASELARVIKSGEERTYARTGKTPVTFTETRTAT